MNIQEILLMWTCLMLTLMLVLELANRRRK